MVYKANPIQRIESVDAMSSSFTTKMLGIQYKELKATFASSLSLFASFIGIQYKELKVSGPLSGPRFYLWCLESNTKN